MPSTINGIGTNYVGRTDVHTYLGSCSKCHNYTQLTSYSTSLYFTFLFVPLVKLGGRRVMGFCPSCTNHSVMKLKQFEAARDTAIPEAAQAYASRPNDAEAAGKLLGLCAFFEDESTFLASTEQMEARFANHADVQEGLAESYAFFNFPDAAVEAYERSIAAKDQPHVRGRLALMYLHLKRTEDAARTYQPLAEQQTQDYSPLARLIVNALASEGHHEDALAMLDSFDHVSLDPESKQANEQLRRKLVKAKEKGASLKADVLPSIDLKKPRESRLVGKVAVVIGPLVLLAIITTFVCVSLYVAGHREVYLVNGLPNAYTVTINGTTQYTITPSVPQRVTLAEGTITIDGSYDGKPLSTQIMQLESGFFSRVFSTPLVLLNPDRSAALVWQETSYATTPGLATHSDYEYLSGEFAYIRPRTDYFFEPFPQQIKMSSDSSVIVRDRIDIFRDPRVTASSTRFALERQELSEARAIELLKHRTSFVIDDSIALEVLSRAMPAADYVAYVQTRLDERPVWMEWHRGFQTFVDREQLDIDLPAMYQRLLDADPQNADLLYLRGRVEPDVDAQLAFFEQGASATPPSSFAIYALGFNQLSQANYEQAVALMEQAQLLHPASTTIAEYLYQARKGAGQYDQVAEYEQQMVRKFMDHRVMVERQMATFYQQGKTKEAAKVLGDFLTGLDQRYPSSDTADAVAGVTAINAYLAGDMIGFAQYPVETSDDIAVVELHLLDNDYEHAAQAAVGLSEKPDQVAGLLLTYIAADQAGQTEFAQQQLTSAIELMVTGTKDQQRFAAMMNGESSPEFDALRKIQERPQVKGIWLLAAGQRFPAIRQSCWDLSRKLNIMALPPARLVDTLSRFKPQGAPNQ